MDTKTNLLSPFYSSNYVIMVTMFFTVSVINNYALNFNIAMPLHMIFRSVRTVVPLLFTFICFIFHIITSAMDWSPSCFSAGIINRQHDPWNNHPEEKVQQQSYFRACKDEVMPAGLKVSICSLTGLTCVSPSSHLAGIQRVNICL